MFLGRRAGLPGLPGARWGGNPIKGSAPRVTRGAEKSGEERFFKPDLE